METAGGVPALHLPARRRRLPTGREREQWAQMQRYLLPCCMPTGAVYVACRGVTDSWKLHWEERSFALYERLIEREHLKRETPPSLCSPL